MSDREERRSGRKRDAFQSVIPYVIHRPDAQINAIQQRREEGAQPGERGQEINQPK